MAKESIMSTWSECEKWAWNRILSGEVADFSTALAQVDPAAAQGRPPGNLLRAAFMRTILFDRHFSDKVHVEGVRITAARWEEPLLIPYASLRWPLCLEKGRFEGPVDLTGLRLDGRLSFKESEFRGGGEARSLRLDAAKMASADLSGATFRSGLSAVGAVFEGLLDLSHGQIKGLINLERAKVGCLFMREAGAHRICLSNAEVDQDVDLSAAVLTGTLRMNDIHIGQDLSLGALKDKRARFEGGVNLIGAVVGGYVNLTGVSVLGSVDMNDIEIKKHLFMRRPVPGEGARGRTTFHDNVTVTNARVQGHLELSGALFRKGASFAGIQVGAVGADHVVFRGPFDFSGARVQGFMNFLDARFSKAADFKGIQVTGDFAIQSSESGHARCETLSIDNASIGGAIIIQPHASGPVSLTGTSCRHLFMRHERVGKRIRIPVFRGSVDLSYAAIKEIADLDGGAFRNRLVLAGTQVGAELRLGATVKGGKAGVSGQEPYSAASLGPGLDLSAARINGGLQVRIPRPWRAGAINAVALDLRDARAGSLHIPRDWPRTLRPGSVQLDGFTYERLRESAVLAAEEMINRPAEWFRAWLELDDPYSPQPYEHLAGVLRQAGQIEKANEILFASRERARKAARTSGQRWRARGLNVLRLTIGYGIGLRFFYALLWAGGATLAGTALLCFALPTGAGGQALDGIGQKLAYSFDQLLPIIELNSEFGKVRLPWAFQYYFYVHELVGFLLGTFIAAGIAGLTQRSRS